MDSEEIVVNNQSNKKTFLEVLNMVYGVTLMLGPLALPVAILARNVEYRWVPFVATPVFILTMLIRRRLSKET